MAEELRRFRLRVRPGLEDDLLALLAAAGIRDAFGRRDYPHGLLADEPDPEPLEASILVTLPAGDAKCIQSVLAGFLAEAGQEWPGLEPVPGPIPPRDQLETAWQEAWRPFRCAGFVVHAEFVNKSELAMRPHDVPLMLATGSSFGTGGHPTTRMGLRAVRALWNRGHPPRWLDVGTGSGILAVAAARLGAERVFALDPEGPSPPQALRMAALNEVGGRVQAWRGRLDSSCGTYSAIVANLFADLLQEEAERWPGLLAPHGLLYTGGIVDRRWKDTQERLRAAGLRLLGCEARGRWRGAFWEASREAAR